MLFRCAARRHPIRRSTPRLADRRARPSAQNWRSRCSICRNRREKVHSTPPGTPSHGPSSEFSRLSAAVHEAKAQLPQDLFDLVSRASAFCTWSDGAAGPTGGALYRLWDESARRGALPTPAQLEEAAATAKCNRMTLDPTHREVAVSPGSELDLRGFRLRVGRRSCGPQLDRGRSHQSQGRARPGDPRSRRWAGRQGVGSCPADALHLGQPEQPDPPAGPIRCRRRSLLRDLEVAGDRIPTTFDLRSGKPATGVSLVAAVTTFAADAEPLALAMSVLGANGGQLRLGSLQPKPSVLWLLGSGASAVIASSNWSAVHRP